MIHKIKTVFHPWKVINHIHIMHFLFKSICLSQYLIIDHNPEARKFFMMNCNAILMRTMIIKLLYAMEADNLPI